MEGPVNFEKENRRKLNPERLEDPSLLLRVEGVGEI